MTCWSYTPPVRLETSTVCCLFPVLSNQSSSSCLFQPPKCLKWRARWSKWPGGSCEGLRRMATAEPLECCFMGRRKQNGELQDREPSLPAGSHGLCSFAALCCRAQHNSPEMVKQLQFEMKAGATSPGTWGRAQRQQRGGGRWSRCPVPWEMVFVKDNSPWWKSRQGYQENRTLFWKVETH